MVIETKIENVDIPKDLSYYASVTVKNCGNSIQTCYVSHRNTKAHILKIDKERYIHLATGVVKEFKHNTNRKDDINAVRCSLGRLRDYINTNVTEPFNCRWVTLTYAENMQDTKRLYENFSLFIKRLRYEIGMFEYIVAMEPQGRGAWHAHLLLIFTDIAPYIPNTQLANIWANGFVTIKALDKKGKRITNIGAYLTAYLGDLDVTTENIAYVQEKGGKMILKTVEEDINGKRKKKRLIKGGRLYMYPVGFHLYRVSKGIKKPFIERVTEMELQQRMKNIPIQYEKAIQVTTITQDDYSDEISENTILIYYRNYNLLDKPTPPPHLLQWQQISMSGVNA